MDDRDVIKVEEYIQKMPKPASNDTKEIFDIHTYSRWAANEILERMIDETMKLPSHITGKESMSAVDIIENFIDEMDYYSWVSSSHRAKTIFRIARDEGKCVLLYVCS